MFERIWNKLGRVAIGSCAALLLVAGSAQADDAAKDKEIQELKARQEEQAKQIDYLKRILQSQQVTPTFTTGSAAATRSLGMEEIKELVADAIKDSDAKKAADDAAKKKAAQEAGYEVGSDLRMNASWRNGLVLETEQKDFRIHLGGYVQIDSVFFQQPNNLRGAPPGGALGIPGTTGEGIFDDGTFFRRARLMMDGQAYENWEFTTIFQFENVTRVTFDEVWMGVKDLPIVGTARIGHIKVPQGLESYSSSRFIEYIERGANFDAFEVEFADGILLTNNFADQHGTWALSVFKNEIIFNQDGAGFGDGTYAAVGRVTLLPIYENDGRCLLHLGASFKYQLGDVNRDTNLPGTPVNGGAPLPFGVDTSNVVRFRARPDLRDSVTDFTGGLQTTFGNNNRIIDTGNILTPYQMVTGGELLGYFGRFNVQSEATWTHMDHAFYPTAAVGAPVPGNPLAVPFQHVGSLDFWGGYASAGFFILNGKRGYDRRLGRYDRVIPDENFFLVKGEDGSTHAGLGALEALFRVTYIDLNDKIVKGGQMTEQTIGLNWYWNPNARIMANYFWAERDVIAPPGFVKPNNGTLHGLGIQAAFDF